MSVWPGKHEFDRLIQETRKASRVLPLPPVVAAKRPPLPTPQPYHNMDSVHSRCQGIHTLSCNYCAKVSRPPKPNKKRYFDEKLDPLDTEYDQWKVEAGLIEPYFRQVIAAWQDRKLDIDTGEIKAQYLEDTTTPILIDSVRTEMLPEPVPVYEHEMRWKLTELGQKTVPIQRRRIPLPSGIDKEKLVICWDSLSLEPHREPRPNLPGWKHFVLLLIAFMALSIFTGVSNALELLTIFLPAVFGIALLKGVLISTNQRKVNED